MKKHRTDITVFHHPHEYEILAPEKHPIYIGTLKQCQDRLKEIKKYNLQYSNECQIRKV